MKSFKPGDLVFVRYYLGNDIFTKGIIIDSSEPNVVEYLNSHTSECYTELRSLLTTATVKEFIEWERNP